MSEESPQYRPYKPPKDREKEELEEELKRKQKELARKEAEIEDLRKEKGRTTELERQIQKLTGEVSGINESLKKIEQTLPPSLMSPSVRPYLDSRAEARLGDPPIWALLQPGVFFEYITWDVVSGDGLCNQKYVVLSKSNQLCELEHVSDRGIAREVSKYFVDSSAHIHSEFINGEPVNLVPGIDTMTIWINTNKVRIGSQFEQWARKYKIVSTEKFNGRECLFAKDLKFDDHRYYDLETGLFLREQLYNPAPSLIMDLFRTNLRGLSSYQGEIHKINPQKVREDTQTMVDALKHAIGLNGY